MCIRMDGTEQPLPLNAELLTDNGVSRVYRGHDGFVYKRSLPFLIENELHFLRKMYTASRKDEPSFVPQAHRSDKYTIKMTDLGKSQPITNKADFLFAMFRLLKTLQNLGIRHGDLTRYSIIVRDNHPFLIDFAESRSMKDPRPDKREEGDFFWLHMTIQKLLDGVN